MTVVPVGAALPNGIVVGEQLAWSDPREGDFRNAIHSIREDDTVPMDRRVLIQRVGNVQRDGLALVEPQEWRWHRAVDRHRGRAPVTNRDRRAADDQIEDLVLPPPSNTDALFTPRKCWEQTIEPSEAGKGGAASPQEIPPVHRDATVRSAQAHPSTWNAVAEVERLRWLWASMSVDCIHGLLVCMIQVILAEWRGHKPQVWFQPSRLNPPGLRTP